MIDRTDHTNRLRELLRNNPVVAILGARQVGKTTLGNEVTRRVKEQFHTFDLEKPSDLARISDAELTLSPLSGLVVIDEIQRQPGLFPLLRVLADRPAPSVRFLIMGSASPSLLRQGNESLAGRIAYYQLGGFNLSEVGRSQESSLWLRGGFPRSLLAPNDLISFDWREHFISTFLERDLPQLGIRVASSTLRRFWTMLSHSHGQIWNASVFSRNFGVNHVTIRRYLDILNSSLVIRILQPWHENVKKRQVKSPKVYFSDTGLLHTLLGIVSREDLEAHPIVGVSWESFALNEIIEHIQVRPHECFFWATHAGSELDLLLVRGNRRIGFEFKRTSTPTVSRSMHVALSDLRLEHLYVVHPGEHSFPLQTNMSALALSTFRKELPSWGK